MGVSTSRIWRKVFDGEVGLYVARPADRRAHPGVLVAMDAFGVTPWLEALADRLAGLGYVVAVPDLYHRQEKRAFGPEEEAEARGAASGLSEGSIVTDTNAALDFLKEPLVSRGHGLGVMGFSAGARIAFQTACHHIELRSAAIYCPIQIVSADKDPRGMRPIDRALWLRARLLGLYAGRDELVPEEERRVLAETLSGFNKPHELVVYPEVAHRFYDEDSPQYDADAAKDAWTRVTSLFGAELGRTQRPRP